MRYRRTVYPNCAILALLTPLLQWIWKKCILKPMLNFYPTGIAYLYINRCGSYIRIDGVFEALRKSLSIKRIEIQIVRNKDNSMLNLCWSSFINPSNQQIMGAFTSTSEIAHAFRIEADNVVCAFIEYGDFYNSSYKILQPYFEVLSCKYKQMAISGLAYEDIVKKCIELPEYKQAKESLIKELFWEIGQYNIKMLVEFGKQKMEFRFKFNISKELKDAVMANVDEILMADLKDILRVPRSLKVTQVELIELN